MLDRQDRIQEKGMTSSSGSTTIPPVTETAQRIAEMVRDQPGLTSREIASCLGFSRGTIEYHMRHLVRTKIVRESRIGRARRCFPVDMVPSQILRIGVLRQRRAHELARVVLKTPGIMQRDLTLQISMTRKVFRSCVRLLVGAGLLREEKLPNRCHYFPTQPLREIAKEREILGAAPYDACWRQREGPPR